MTHDGSGLRRWIVTVLGLGSVWILAGSCGGMGFAGGLARGRGADARAHAPDGSARDRRLAGRHDHRLPAAGGGRSPSTLMDVSAPPADADRSFPSAAHGSDLHPLR